MTRLTLLLAAYALLSVANAQCPSVRTRYECREMPEASRNALFNAIKGLMTSGAYTKYVDMHVAVTSTAHGVPEFLPWHRHYLYTLEKELGQNLCYWDWATDAQAPEVSIINAPNWCGSDGGGNCVKDAFYGTYSYQNECVSTQWDGGAGKIGSFYSIDYVAKIISDNDSYDGFRVPYEGTAHARVHNGLGGMFSKMMSPANPAFFLHHANVDRHYAIWQWAHPAKAKDFPKPLTTELPEYKGVQVGSVMDTRAAPYCYTYSNIDIISTGRSTAGLNRRALKLSMPVTFKRQGSDCTKCGGVDEATGKPYPPCDDDRTNIIDLRAVKPTPDSWCKMNNVNCTVVREHEEKHRGFIKDLNALPGYVSPSALYNRPRLLTELVKRGGTDFYLYNDKHEKVSLPCPQQYKDAPEKAIEMLRESVKKSYPVKSYKDLAGPLRKLVGNLADTLMKVGEKTAMKPYVEVKPQPEDDELEYCEDEEEEESDYGSNKGSAYGNAKDVGAKGVRRY